MRRAARYGKEFNRPQPALQIRSCDIGNATFHVTSGKTASDLVVTCSCVMHFKITLIYSKNVYYQYICPAEMHFIQIQIPNSYCHQRFVSK